ncbi:diacylglycerol/lipid kinase family protein [Cryptosporangium arvum]|uniref:Sphingosine/diacylglycerol kinase-like enzyme n=1 Tax=Cryptosporangium arvum DSM 44712 TaxID=927661 RepID=A0A010YZ17_9ACTN|nr:diacylglycerol kinase family protein [Cryptosporangium arvum]EXG80468.1 sphingosine/diacylglycerol kinase-like enzyme [Cryptosporangium arvum DSM 44712]
MPQELLVIVNEGAGSTELAAVDKAVEVLRRVADVVVARTADLDALGAALRIHRERTTVLAGGDGSLHAAVQLLYDAHQLDPQRPFGLIPLGTGNDLARTLGIPLDPVAAAETVLDGYARALDIAVDNTGEVLVNAAHAGVGAEAGRLASGWKPTLGVAAYPLGGLVAGFTSEGWHMAIEVDGEQVHGPETPVLMLGIGNGRSIGGGTPLAPNAEPDDGLLDVVVAAVQGPRNRYEYGLALRNGVHIRREDVQVYRGGTVVLKVPDGADVFRVNTDGEISDEVTHRSWDVKRGVYSILVSGSARAVW